MFAPRQLVLTAVELPHPEAKRKLTELDGATLYAVAPGDSVSLKIDNRAGAAVDSSQLEAAMEQAIAAAQWRRAASAEA